jgi:tetratricopeptide (TPR) repeat protein
MAKETIGQLVERGFDLVESGQLVEARTVFEQVCQQDKDNAEAWMMRGSVNLELGNADEAYSQLSRAVEMDPTLPEAFYYLTSIHRARNDLDAALTCIQKAMQLDAKYGEAFLLGGAIYGLLGRFDESEQCCRKAVALLPGSPEAHYNFGNLLSQKGKISEACQQFEAVVSIRPTSLNARLMLGRSYAQLGELAKSAAAYQQALRLKPDSAQAYYGLGYVDYRQGRFIQAAEKFRRTLDINPNDIEAANSLGTVYQALGRYQDAIEAFQRALNVRPDYAEALFGTARALIDLSRHMEAVPLLQRAVQLRPDYIEAYLNLAGVLMYFDRLDEAMEWCGKALELQPDALEAVAMAARIELQGRSAEAAYQRLAPHIGRGVHNVNLHVVYGEICRSLDRPKDAIPPLESLLAQSQGLTVTNQRNLHFCLGGLYDKAGDYDRAFAHYERGNDLRAVSWDAATNRAQVDAITAAFSKQLMADAPRATVRSQKPVFVLGMPRSGTTLVEQILASHPAVFGAGELPDLLRLVAELPGRLGTDVKYPQCMRLLDQDTTDLLAEAYLQRLEAVAPGAGRVVDKMPGNFSFLGLIELLFPEARVIHCRRDPLDTCLSCYFQDFAMSQPYSFNLAHLGLFYRDYERLMAHWKAVLNIPMLEVSYEELVNDQEQVSRQLVEFCGLEWDDKCLRFHENDRYVATSSYDQVRRPVYSSSVKRWQKYEKHLGPLIDALR